MSKLDPELLRIAERHRERRANRSTGLRTEAAPPTQVSLFVEFSGPIGDLVACGFQAHTVLGGAAAETTIATGRIPVDALGQLVEIEHVTRVEGAQPVVPLLNQSLVRTRIAPLHEQPYSLTGRGVVIGIIDVEVDIFHKTFRTNDDKTRILALWNQVLSTPHGEFGHSKDYGVEYLDTEINVFLENPASAMAAMGSETLAAMGGTAALSHGTGVAGIAAGNGAVDGRTCLSAGERKYVGVAPEADLIVVTMPSRRPGSPPQGFEGLTDTGTSSQILDGLDYIFGHPKVNGRPVVVNISMGVRRGPHDGTSLLDQAVDRLLFENARYKPGRAVVVATGNEASRQQHVSGVANAAGFYLKFTLNSDVATTSPDGDIDVDGLPQTSPNRLQVWCRNPSSRGTLKATLLTSLPDPVDHLIGPLLTDGVGTMTVEDKTVSMRLVPYGEKLCVDIEWEKGGKEWSPREWGLMLYSVDGEDVAVDAWLDSKKGKFLKPVPTSDRTVASPATANHVIAVGSYRNLFDEGIAASSSYGPTGDGRDKPDVVAPGALVVSAQGRPAYGGRVRADLRYKCCSFCWEDYEVTIDPGVKDFHNTSGTSFAAPHVTGLVALMFQEKSDLNVAQARRVLRETAEKPAGVTGVSPYGQWGWGKINGVAAINGVRALDPDGGGGNGRQLTGAGGQRVSATGDCGVDSASGDSRTDLGKAPEMMMTSISHVAAPFADRPRTGNGGIQTADSLRLDHLSDSRWMAMVSRHFSEVRGLITHRRRVAVYWHRIGGPALVRALVQQIGQHAPASRPPVPDADQFLRYLDRFLGELSRLGSAGLRRDVERFQPLLRAMAPATVVSVVAAAFSATEEAA